MIQNKHPPNVPLLYVGYFELKIIKAKNTQEEIFTFPLTDSKHVNRETCPERQPSPEITTKS